MHNRYSILVFLLVLFSFDSKSQENIFSHFYTSASYYNPAFSGDVRYASLQTANRIVDNSGAKVTRNTLIGYDQKIRNYRSGLSFQINQEVSDLDKLKLKASYSYTFSINKRFNLKSGIGLSWNFMNTHAPDYKFPDQYNQSGYTGQPTTEASLNEKANYPGFAAGLVFHDDFSFISIAVDDVNRPVNDFAGQKTHVPVTFSVTGAYMFPLDKNKKTKRLFSANGGLEPYSSLGPVLGFYKKGFYNICNMGLFGFVRPVFFGVDYRYNSYNKNYFTKGVSTLGLLLGYRAESFSISYSYDLRLDKNDVNYRGVHEISLSYYLYTVKKDYIKNKLVPLPNQLMY